MKLTRREKFLSILLSISIAGYSALAYAQTRINLNQIQQQATNTVIGNFAAGTGNLTALNVGSCTAAGSALKWTTNTGFGCNTSIDAATLGGQTFASPAAIGTGTPAAGTFTSLSTGSGAISGGAISGTTGVMSGLVRFTGGGNGYAMQVEDLGTVSGAALIQFLNNNQGTLLGSITRNAATSAVLYNTSSDARLKENFQPLKNSLAIVESINVGTFNWKDGNGSGVGVIAQDLYKVYPDAVAKGRTDDEMWGVDYGKLTPILIGSVKELAGRLRQLEAKLTAENELLKKKSVECNPIKKENDKKE